MLLCCVKLILFISFGVNLGEVVEEVDCIYGDGANIAARTEGLARPGGFVSQGPIRIILNYAGYFSFILNTQDPSIWQVPKLRISGLHRNSMFFMNLYWISTKI